MSVKEFVTSISIVIPTCKSHPGLKKLLDSISWSLCSSLLPCEVFVVGDARTAHQDFLKEAHPFTLKFLRSKDIGVNSKRNLGLNHSSGEVVFFIDDDCEVTTSDFFLRHLELHILHPKVLIIGGSYENLPSSYWGKVYSNVQMSWLNSAAESNPFVGGNLSMKSDPSIWIRFNESIRFGGSETELIRKMKASQVLRAERIKISHHVDETFFSFIKKAYLQGRTKGLFQHKSILPSQGYTKPPSKIFDVCFNLGFNMGQRYGFETPKFWDAVFTFFRVVFLNPFISTFWHRSGLHNLLHSIYYFLWNQSGAHKHFHKIKSNFWRVRHLKWLIFHHLKWFFINSYFRLKMLYGHKILPKIQPLLKSYYFLKYQWDIRFSPEKYGNRPNKNLSLLSESLKGFFELSGASKIFCKLKAHSWRVRHLKWLIFHHLKWTLYRFFNFLKYVVNRSRVHINGAKDFLIYKCGVHSSYHLVKSNLWRLNALKFWLWKSSGAHASFHLVKSNLWRLNHRTIWYRTGAHRTFHFFKRNFWRMNPSNWRLFYVLQRPFRQADHLRWMVAHHSKWLLFKVYWGLRSFYGHHLLDKILKLCKPYYFLKYQFETRIKPLLSRLEETEKEGASLAPSQNIPKS